MGSIVCTHWQWLKGPTALAGKFHDRKGGRSVVVESICEEDMYIWRIFSKVSGSYNDMNALACSPMILDVKAGVRRPRNMKYTLNGRTCRLHYYTADQGYPLHALFAIPHPNPVTPKRRLYNRKQQAFWTDAERFSSVMPSRFNINLRPARFTTTLRIINTGKAVAILHNMAIECTRSPF